MNERFTGCKWEYNPEMGLVIPYGESSDNAVASVCENDKRERSEIDANMRLIAHAPEMYYSHYNLLFEINRGSLKDPGYVDQLKKGLADTLREINPNFDKIPKAIDIIALARTVKLMRDSQKNSIWYPSSQCCYEACVDNLVAQILGEVNS